MKIPIVLVDLALTGNSKLWLALSEIIEDSATSAEPFKGFSKTGQFDASCLVAEHHKMGFNLCSPHTGRAVGRPREANPSIEGSPQACFAHLRPPHANVRF